MIEPGLAELAFNVIVSDQAVAAIGLQRDVGGAQSAGMQAAWLNRLDLRKDEPVQPDYTLKNLYDLRGLLEMQSILIPANGSVPL